MEEIKAAHEISLEWGCVANLIDKIAEIEEQMDGHWDELLNMIADMVDEAGRDKDPASVFFGVYQFTFRLYYRLRTNPTRRTFNQVSKINVGGKEIYRIINYDYKTFEWARGAGFVGGISNDCLDLPADKLTTNQRRAFDRRIGEKK